MVSNLQWKSSKMRKNTKKLCFSVAHSICTIHSISLLRYSIPGIGHPVVGISCTNFRCQLLRNQISMHGIIGFGDDSDIELPNPGF